MRRYGEVGTFRGDVSTFTFMVVAPETVDRDALFQDLLSVVLLDISGRLVYRGRIMGVGDMGPVEASAKEITWIDPCRE